MEKEERVRSYTGKGCLQGVQEKNQMRWDNATEKLFAGCILTEAIIGYWHGQFPFETADSSDRFNMNANNFWCVSFTSQKFNSH